MRKHYTEAQRAALIDLVTSGQASLRAAAARLDVADSTAYYWLKRARRTGAAVALVLRRNHALAERRSSAPPTFARLVRPADAATAITLRVGGAVIEVRPGFDSALLHDIVVALAESAQ
jgi:transposase-like protein